MEVCDLFYSCTVYSQKILSLLEEDMKVNKKNSLTILIVGIITSTLFLIIPKQGFAAKWHACTLQRLD
jgi:hypothetical protein